MLLLLLCIVHVFYLRNFKSILKYDIIMANDSDGCLSVIKTH